MVAIVSLSRLQHWLSSVLSSSAPNSFTLFVTTVLVSWPHNHYFGLHQAAVSKTFSETSCTIAAQPQDISHVSRQTSFTRNGTKSASATCFCLLTSQTKHSLLMRRPAPIVNFHLFLWHVVAAAEPNTHPRAPAGYSVITPQFVWVYLSGEISSEPTGQTRACCWLFQFSTDYILRLLTYLLYPL